MPSTHGERIEPQPCREARRFRGGRDLEPLRLANSKRHTVVRDAQSARTQRAGRYDGIGEADIGLVRMPQSAQ